MTRYVRSDPRRQRSPRGHVHGRRGLRPQRPASIEPRGTLLAAKTLWEDTGEIVGEEENGELGRE